jgi:D-3-phosphoglycerate dehydrogenase
MTEEPAAGSAAMRKSKVLITDHSWPSVAPEQRILEEAGATVVVARSGEQSELLRLAPDVDAILTCFATVSGEMIRAAKHLKIIGRYGIGVDNIDVATATQQDVLVTNVPAYCLDEVAEHVLALLLTMARNLRSYDTAIRASDWSLTAGRPLFRVRGQTLGIVGFGKIGRTVAQKVAGLSLRVLAYDPVMDGAAIRAEGAVPVPLQQLMADSDFVTLHVPLNGDTKHLINAELLGLMKPSAFLINASRGAIVDKEALIDALNGGRLAGAALDVFEPEKPAVDDPLWKARNLLATPHVAFYSEESVLELEIKAAQNVIAVLHGRRPESVVNPEVLDRPRWIGLTPKEQV